MFTFTTQRNAARHGADVTDPTWSATAVADGVVVADYTVAPVTLAGFAEARWLTMRGTDLDAYENIVAPALHTLAEALDAAEDDARGLYQGATDAAADRVMPDPDHLAAMGAYFGAAYREAFEAWVADEAAAEAERLAGA